MQRYVGQNTKKFLAKYALRKRNVLLCIIVLKRCIYATLYSLKYKKKPDIIYVAYMQHM